MDRDVLIQVASDHLKTLRLENDYTIDKMAEIIGIQKKTLLKIEAGKVLASWTTTISVCTLFGDSRSLKIQLGGDPLEMIELAAIQISICPKEKTLGGVIMWKNIQKHKGYKLQKNIVTRHFRIIDHENYRILSTFNEKVAKEKWRDIVRTIKKTLFLMNIKS